jgi:hypothetical protein
VTDFTGKQGLIVGVANKRSIAWAIAQATATRGARLALTYQGRFEEHVTELSQGLSAAPLVLPCDVSSDDDIAAAWSLLLVARWSCCVRHGGAEFGSRYVVRGAAVAPPAGSRRRSRRPAATGFRYLGISACSALSRDKAAPRRRFWNGAERRQHPHPELPRQRARHPELKRHGCHKAALGAAVRYRRPAGPGTSA